MSGSRNSPLKPDGGKASADNSTASKWWVDLGGKEGGRRQSREPRPEGLAGMSFFTVAKDFEQDAARERLTDNNLRLLTSADPPEGEWTHVRLAETSYPKRDLERVKSLIELPPYARGVIVDSGRMIRLLVTATPIGDRILELALGASPSFDCWIQQDWVREEVFDDAERAIRALRRHIRNYLAPEAVARHDKIVARA